VALVDGVLNHELRAPSGEVIDADGIELGGIASGEALEVPLTLHLGALTRGTYRLDYTVEGVGQSFRGQFSFRVGVDLVARSDEPSYVEGDPFVIELAIRNTGDLSWAGSASVTSTLLPEEEVRDVELDPETDTTLAVEGRIPEGVDPGVHEVAVALRVGDSVLERTLQVRIPMPRVTFEEPARTWRPGDVLELTATSSGGVSFEGDATIRVRGPGGYAAEASLPLDLPARTSGTLELPLPGELASGEYLLDVTLVDRRVGQLVASLVRWIDIVGTDVVLSTETRLHVHLAGDTIGTTTRVEVGDAALEQATLVLRIVPAVPPEAEPFAMRVHDAIQQGLRWLRLNQDGNGGWPGGPNSEWNGGLPVLAFLEEPAFPGWSAPSLGYAGLRGSNRSAVERAVRYLVRVKLRDPDDALVVGYGAALMGLSAYLATGGPDADWGIGATVRETLHDALEHLRSGMNPSGTWCYYGRGCEDSSVTWFAAAGLAAGATFFEEAAADLPTVAGWYQETNRNDDGGSGNRVGLPSSPPQSAVALFVRLLGGVERSEERLQAGVGYLRDSYDYLGEETGWDYLTYLWALSRGLSGLGRDLGPDLLSAADVGGVRDPTADGYPEAPAGWRYDLAWRLLELQDDEGLFVNPNGTDNPTADHAFALLVLERSVGGVCFDSDHDGVCEVFDNCPETPNPGQTDIDQDRVGDACEDTRAAWEEEVPVAVEAGEAVTVERDVAVDLLGATGRMSLAAEVRSTEGQVLAAAAQEFWVAEGGLIVTVATDRPAYRSGEQVTISGTVENHTGQRLEGVELRVRKENGRRQTLLSETLDLEPAAVHPFEVQTEAQSRFRVVASAADEGASLEVPVTVTSIRHTVFVPGEGGLDPVVARVTLINQGKDADQVSVTFAVPGQEARRIDVVVPPGSARQVEEPFEIREDTLLQVDIEGALEAHEEHLVRFVRSLVVRMAPDPVQPEGLVAVPVLVDNRGRGDQPVQARVEVFRTDPDNEDGEVFVEGADIDLQAPGGVTSEATALFRLPAGTYRVRLQAPPDEQQAWVAVQPAAAVRLSAEVLPPEAGQVAVHVHTHNWGQLGLAGRLRVEGAGGASSKEVELPARAAETHTLPILPAVDGPGTYPVTVRLTSGGEELARAETVLDLVGPRVVLRAGPEPSPLELFAGGVGQVEFELANDGDLPGWAVLSARLGDLGEAESRLWLEPAAQQHLVLPISVPPDYPSGEVRGTFSLAGGAGELRVIVRGADLEVDAALDAPAYDPGDTARLAITVRSVGDADLDLRCVLPAGGAQEEHAFRLDAPGEHTCWFEIPVGEEGDRLLPFGVYHASGRAVHLGSVMLRSLAGALVVSTDRPSYGPGDTVRGVVQAARPGRVEVLSPFGQELALDVDAQAAFELRVPDDVMTGLHAIRLDYAGEEFTYDLVVLGLSVEVREVVPDRSRYGGQDELVAEVTLHSNAERDVLLVATHQDPAGDTAELDTVEHRLLDGRSTARLSGWLATTLAGAHRLQVTVHLVGEAPPGADGAEQPGQVLASEETSFEVGRFRLVALRPRREVFLVGEDVEVSAEVWIDVADVGGGPPLELLHVVDGAAGDRILIGEDGFETVAMPVGRLEYGSHRLVAWLTDGDVSSPLEILVRVGDGTPPRTTLRVEGPQHEDFVAPSTRFVLEAEDEASGVAATEYAVDAAALAPYEGPFGVEGHGPHTLRYRSVDVAGNAELVREEVVVLDERPPQVVLQVGPPSHPLDEGHLVAPESAIDVEAADEGEHDSGLASAAVRLDEQEWTEPPLALAGLADGPYRVEVRAEDRVENTAEAAGTLVVDSQPPAISLTPDRDTQAVGPVAVAFRVEDGGDPAPLVESTLESGTELVVDGLYELRVRAEDHLDHAAEAAVHVGLETPPCGERGAGCPAGADCNPSGHCEVGDGFDVEVALPAAVVVLGVDASRAEEVCALCDTEAAGEAACRPEEVRAGEAPRRRVQLPAFLMDRTEVTNAQHRACVEAGACPAVAAVPGLPEGYAQDPAYADHPVLGASREAAAAYCAWLGKRLPTPDEWERAAAGLVGRPWPWGGEPPEGQAGEAGPAAAAAEEPGSIYGLLGLAGNAEEWACDAGECRLRGGSWQSTTPCDLRTTRRAPAPGAGDEARRAGVGLRCVRPDCELADPACVEAASAAPGPGAPFGDAGPDTGWEPDPDAGTPGEGEGEGEGGGEGCECGLGGGGAGLPALVVLLGLLVTAWRRGRRRSGARGRLAGLGVAILATLASGDVGAQDLGTRSFRLVQVELGSVTFKSDHRKLRNAEGSLLSVGTPFGKPEWQAGRPWREGEPESAYPVTHSGSSSVELDVHLRLHPPEAAGGVEVTLRGDGPDLGGGDGPLRPLDFSARAALSASAPRVSLTADTDLPSDVTALEDQDVVWTLELPDEVECRLGSTRHDVYVTLDEPVRIEDQPTEVSLARIREITAFVDGAETETDVADRLVTEIHGRVPFGGNHCPVNPWVVYQMVLDSEPLAYDCLAQAAFMQVAAAVVGVPSEVGFVYATSGPGRYSTRADAWETHPDHDDWILTYTIPGARGSPLGNLWESVCRVGGRDYAVSEGVSCTSPFDVICYIIGDGTSNQQRWARPSEHGSWELIEGEDPVPLPGCPDEPDCR